MREKKKKNGEEQNRERLPRKESNNEEEAWGAAAVTLVKVHFCLFRVSFVIFNLYFLTNVISGRPH